MHYFTKPCYCILFLGIFADSLAPTAHAGAWTLEPGSGQVIATVDQVYADTFFRPNGKNDNGIEFTKSDLRLYAEQGLLDSLTLVIQTGYQAAQISTSNQEPRSRSGLSNFDAGLRYRFWHNDKVVLSGQAMISARGEAYGLPGAPLTLMKSGTDVELRMMAGHSWNIRGYDGFSEIQIGNREFGSGGGNAQYLDITGGVEINTKFQLLGQVFSTQYTGERPHKSVRIQPSLVYKASQNRKYQFGAYGVVSGENATQDRGLTLSLWQSY